MPREREEEWVTIEVYQVKYETEKAFLVLLEGDREEWLPKSQLRDPEGLSEQRGEAEIVDVEISAWIAEQKGLT